MYFPHAFRKSFLPSTVASTTLSTATLGTTTGTVLTFASTTSVATGMSVSGTGIAAGTVVTGFNATTVILSLPITAAVPSGTTITFGNQASAVTINTSVALNAPNVLQFTATTGVSVGMGVTGTSIPSGTTVTAVSATLVTLSSSVTATISTGASIAFGASAAVLSSGSTNSLTAGQLGFFSPDGLAVQSASAKPFIIAQGSYFLQDKLSPALGGYKESVKSKMINPRYISRVIKITAKRPRQMVVNVPVTCGLACDTTYRLRVDVKGSPALRFLSHNMYRVLDSYTGCCDPVDPTLQKDPVKTLINWKDQINLSPIFNTMVDARVYKLSYNGSTGSTSSSSVGVSSAVLVNTNFTTANGVAIGQKVVGVTASDNIPANSFITAHASGTGTITITFPTQQTAPAIPATLTGAVKFYNDLYSGAAGTPQSGAATVIPGTESETATSGVYGSSTVVSSGTATNATIGAVGSNGAALYTGLADAASFSVDAHIELTGAYVETKFGTATFTPTDKYDLEPLLMYTAIVDETGDPCSSFCFTTTNTPNATTGLAPDGQGVIQAPIQGSGVGETILRDMILSDRYTQIAFPDSGRVESLRMREIEQNPALNKIDRTALYDQVMVLHSVPRFNNPTGVFDNDQYLLVFNVPTGTSTSALTNYLVNAATAAGVSIPTNSAGVTFEQF